MRLLHRHHRALWALFAVSLVAVAIPATSQAQAAAWPRRAVVVGYDSETALHAALQTAPAQIVRLVPALHTAELRPWASPDRFAPTLRAKPGIRFVERLARRRPTAEPALAPDSLPGGAFEWQFAAARENAVEPSILRAAKGITIAVIDTGADLKAPDLAAKSPTGYSVLSRSSDVTDRVGHGTLVASLAAGSVSNGEGIAGFGGDAKLLVVQAADTNGIITNVDEATAIVYAVDHGARILNLSFGGPQTSTLEQEAIDYAVRYGALVVAAAGNGGGAGDPVEYPAALLQPPGSNGVGGRGLTVAASTVTGAHAGFSTSGSQISIAAPGEAVFGALSSAATSQSVRLPGSKAGQYGFGSGTSFSTPEVAGAAALVWAANPGLSAQDVAQTLKETASGHGAWNAELGFGVIDVAAAVARAQNKPATTAKKRPRIKRRPAFLSLQRAVFTRRPFRVGVTARLRSQGASVRGRLVVLERRGSKGWSRIARATTNRLGRAHWHVSLSPSRGYRLRALFPGAPDLRVAESRTLRVQPS